MPKIVKEALRIDKEAGNDYWEKTLNKEMSKVKVAWQRFNRVTTDQARSVLFQDMIVHQDINCHIEFDVWMNLQQKERFVVGGHTTETPKSIMYFSVVSCDSFHIIFLLAYLHGVDITDIYL